MFGRVGVDRDSVVMIVIINIPLKQTVKGGFLVSVPNLNIWLTY